MRKMIILFGNIIIPIIIINIISSSVPYTRIYSVIKYWRTYGRNNSGAYGYFKVIFGKDISGSYCVSKVLPNSGTNDTTTNVICELNPGEYLWCPHTYETNVNGGTWLINPASSTSGGVLVEGTKMEIIKYKTLA